MTIVNATEVEIERGISRITSAQNGAIGVLNNVALWSDAERPSGKGWKIRTLEKVLKQIRERKYGVTLRTLG